jgi:hypothetical protein
MSENRDAIELADETVLTEITIQPDGRVYVFGASREVLEVLDLISPHDSRLRAILAIPMRSDDSALGTMQ